MRKLDVNEYKLCRMHAELFAASVLSAQFSSPMFIRRFMMSDLTRVWDSAQYLLITESPEDIFEELHKRYRKSTKKPMYSSDEMYWIGYLYRALVCLYGLSSKTVYRLFSAPEILKYYPLYHTFDIEEAAERMMQLHPEYTGDLTEQGVRILRRLYAEEKKQHLMKT